MHKDVICIISKLIETIITLQSYTHTKTVHYIANALVVKHYVS